MSGTGTAGGRIAPGVGANLIGQHAQDRNQEATIYVGNLDAQARDWMLLQQWRGSTDSERAGADTQVSEELVWELFTQAGPVGR